MEKNEEIQRLTQSSSGQLGYYALLLGIVGAFGVISLSYEPRAATIPILVAGITIVVLLIQAGVDLTKPGWVEETREMQVGWLRVCRTCLLLAGFVLLIWLVGYLIAVPVFSLFSMIVIGHTRWTTAVAVTLGLWIFLYALLEVLLQANIS